ncbi:MAG TPA: peptide chain release factor N(5)-glutamine methyltransferase [Terracidiphilus sp.]|nr:peptide chain release factor N(5)-glutamine methyltransferase [Terracidiphilus sp.]
MPTVSEYVLHASMRLDYGPHPDRARRDAETLLLHLLGKNRAWMMAHMDDELGYDCAEQYIAMLERRYKGEPIQYILGETEFYRLPFRVTPDVLIPRPETEHVLEKVLELAQAFEAPRIVDVGTGSGAIAVALAHELTAAIVTATDASAGALAVARENAQRNGVAARVRFIEGDLLEPVAGEQFDIVVSNPPYVAEQDRETLAVEVRDYEPAQALFAGEDGLEIYRRLVPQAFNALAHRGCLVLEIGHGQEPPVGALLAEAGFEQIEFTADLQGIERVACGRKS